MDNNVALADCLMRHLPKGVDAGEISRTSLESQVWRIWEDAQAAWPEIEIAPNDFLRYLAERLSEEIALEEALEQVCAPDLYLACACSAGHREAWDLFDRHFLSKVDAAVLRVCRNAAALDDIKSRVRDRVLFGTEERDPRIKEYRGRGPLGRWLRVVSVREALAAARRKPREIGVDGDDLMGTPASRSDPELSYLRRRYGPEFRRIFRESLAALSREERRLLRHRYLDDLQLDEIASMFGVHSSTISRRLDRARARLLSLTRKGFLEQLGLAPREVESLLGLIASRINLSIQRLLDPKTE